MPRPMIDAVRLPMVNTVDTMPPEVMTLIMRHVDDEFPTRATIESICGDPKLSSHRERILRFFLIESQLNLFDLSPLVRLIGCDRSRAICNGAAEIRKHRQLSEWKPTWQEEVPS